MKRMQFHILHQLALQCGSKLVTVHLSVLVKRKLLLRHATQLCHLTSNLAKQKFPNLHLSWTRAGFFWPAAGRTS